MHDAPLKERTGNMVKYKLNFGVPVQLLHPEVQMSITIGRLKPSTDLQKDAAFTITVSVPSTHGVCIHELDQMPRASGLIGTKNNMSEPMSPFSGRQGRRRR